MNEQMIKDFMRDKICPNCLSLMIKEHPKMLDCAFRHNNDEHLCPKANRLKK